MILFYHRRPCISLFTENFSQTQRVISKGSPIFGTEDYIRKGGHEERYDELLSQNKLLFTLDLIKESLTLAYSRNDEARMSEDIISIMDTCKSTKNDVVQ